MKRRSTEERFWSFVHKTATCWLWTGTTSGSGYGSFWNGSRPMRAHRFSWMLAGGELPAGMELLHQCDNPLCVNPAHLRLGTHAENMQEAKERRRYRYGSDHWVSRNRPLLLAVRKKQRRFSDEQELEIARKYLSGDISTAALGREYGVNQSTIVDILKRSPLHGEIVPVANRNMRLGKWQPGESGNPLGLAVMRVRGSA